MPDYYGNMTQRELAVELADYLAKRLEQLRPDEQRREGFFFGKTQRWSMPFRMSSGCVSATEWRKVVATGASPWLVPR